MPQMSPLMWLNLYLYFFILMIIMMMMIYNIYLLKIMNMKFYYNKFKFYLKW